MMSCLHMPKIISQFAIGVEIWRIILAENLTNTKICTYLANICFKNDKKIKKSADCVETWHTGSTTNSKNFFLLTFFRKIASSTYICNISGFLIQGDLSLTYSKSIFSMKQRI